LGALRVQMMAKVQVVLASFLAFTSFYSANKAYNMLSLMLDPHFKSLDVVKTFVGRAKMIQIVAKYDSKTLLPLLVVAFHFLNPTIDGLIKETLVDDDFIFRAVTLNAATLYGLLKNELGLFCHLHVKVRRFCIPLDLVEVP
jgi:hypothetical protein